MSAVDWRVEVTVGFGDLAHTETARCTYYPTDGGAHAFVSFDGRDESQWVHASRVRLLTRTADDPHYDTVRDLVPQDAGYWDPADN